MSTVAALALPVYAAVVVACIGAVAVAKSQIDRPFDIYHWTMTAMFFAGWAVLRWLNVEEYLRSSARSATLAAGGYESRADFQLPLTIMILLLAMILALLFFFRWRSIGNNSRGRWVILSQFALMGLTALFGLRLVSLHQFDSLLYSGPLRLNWVLEGVLCFVVGGCASMYARRKQFRF